MPDLLWTLADLGRQSGAVLWLPVALWTALALVAEVGLRLGRANAYLGLPVRGAVLAALPVTVALAGVARLLTPQVASAVAASAPAPIARLPEIVVGDPLPALTVAARPPVADVVLGLLVALGVVVGVAGLIRLSVEAVRLHALRRALPAAAPEVQGRLDRARTRLGIARPVRAVETASGVAPFTVGWRRPVVAVPSDLGAADLDAVLTHELAHVDRGDFAWQAAQRAVSAVFVAHPLVHVLGRGLDLDRERAADATVLAVHPEARRSYADLLLSYASLPPPPFALGAAPGASSLKSRILAMTRPVSPDRLRQLLRLGRGLGALTLLLAAGFAVVAAAPASADRLAAVAQTVEGTVVDADTRAPIVGASVQVVGTSVGASTGADGRYRLDAPGGDQVVRVSAPGYEPRTVPLADGQRELDVALTAANAPAPPRPPAPPTPQAAPTPPDVYEVAEVQPELIGGLQGLQSRVEYPLFARQAGIEGQVVIQFVVDESGSVVDPVVLRSPNELLSEAALEAVRESRFTPGQQRGQPVKVRFAVPVTFRLPGGEAQSSAPVDEDELRRRLHYAGTDLSLLDSERLVRHMYRSLLEILDESGSAGGTTVVRYTMHPDGRVSDVQTAESSGSDALDDLARGLVALFQFREDRSPPTPREGTFQLHYVSSQ